MIKKEESAANELLGAFNVANFATNGDANSFWNNLITEQDELEAKRLEEQINGVPVEVRVESHRKKRRMHEEIDEKIVKGAIRGIRRYGFSRPQDVVELVSPSIRNKHSDFEETLINLISRIHTLCGEYMQTHPDAKKNEEDLYIEGIKFNPVELYKKNEDMRLVGLLLKNMKRHENNLPFSLKPPNYADWNSKCDSMVIIGLQKHGFGAWCEITKDEELGLIPYVQKGASVTHIQRRAEAILREAKEFLRKKKLHKQERTEKREKRLKRVDYAKKVMEEQCDNKTGMIGYSAEKCLESLNGVRSYLKKLKYLKKHSDNKQFELDKTSKYISFVGDVVCEENDEVKRWQLWHFIASLTNFSDTELKELYTESIRKRTASKTPNSKRNI
ncbi:hypothetical protein QTN25_004423 [Entamoeba marina]